jgi:hypothetical protein
MVRVDWLAIRSNSITVASHLFLFGVRVMTGSAEGNQTREPKFCRIRDAAHDELLRLLVARRVARTSRMSERSFKGERLR